MKELRAILGLIVLLVGGFVLYKVLPVYWGNFKLSRLLDDQSVIYTYQNKNEETIAAEIAEKAKNFDVVLTPSEVTVVRTPGDLSITAEYSVHVDMPIYPLDLNFKTVSKNHNVMK